MTEIEQKALELVNEVRKERGWQPHLNLSLNDFSLTAALCRAIEQHEAFRQEVSDAVAEWHSGHGDDERVYANLTRFIITKPDPLVDVLKDADDMVRVPDAPSYPEAIRAALAKRGLEIREKEA